MTAEYNNEKFDWYITMLREGKTVTINPYNYGDFLRYVQYLGLEDEFKKMESAQRPVNDATFPMVLDLTFVEKEETHDGESFVRKRFCS
jgi:hypothetical protein